MPDPIGIEKQFHELFQQIEHVESIRHRYALFSQLITTLDSEYKRFDSYIIQLIPLLPPFSDQLTWFGIDPEDLEQLNHIFDGLSAAIDDLRSDPHFQQISDNLRETCILLYACLNEWEAVCFHLDSFFLHNMKLEAYAERSIQFTKDNMIPLLSGYLSMEMQLDSAHSSGYQKKCSRLISGLQSLMHILPDSVFVPVVEMYEYENRNTMKYSRLRKLSVGIYGESDNRDEVSRGFPVFGTEQPVIMDHEYAVLAPRKLAEEKIPALKNRYFKGSVSYILSSAKHVGESANLAVAVLWYTCLMKQVNSREHFLVNPFLAISGNIDADGMVLPVDPETIPIKVKAAFFSCSRVLIVPEEQKPANIEELKKLKHKYPRRALDILGARKCDDLFYDRRASDLIRKNSIRYYAEKISEQKYKVFAWVAIIFLSGFILTQFMIPIDKNPTSFHFKGEYLVLTNSNGFEVTRVLMDSETVHYQNEGSNSIRKPLIVLYDITGDGMNDLIWATRGGAANQKPSTVQALSHTGDTLIWQRDLIQAYSFPRQSADLQAGLRSHEIGIIEISDNDVRLVVNSDTQMYFPALVTTLDLFTGEIVSEYLHTGMLHDMYLEDLTNNGIKEIILLGVNNAYWNASIVVLDALHAGGYSPLTQDYMPEGLENADELAYILVPKTIVGEYLQPVEKFNFGTFINYDEASERFWFVIQEGARTFRDVESAIFILLYFDRSMKPAGVGTSDMYDIIARELYEEGAIPFIPDYDYFQAYQQTLLYWNGETFQTRQE